MTTPNSSWASLDPSSMDINDLLLQIEPFLFSSARKYVSYTTVPRSVLDMEIDEIVQNTRVKLWLNLHKGRIKHLKSYAERIVYNECINLVRRYKRTTSLTLNEDGAFHAGTLLMNSSQEALDPANDFEWREAIIDSAKQAAQRVLALPPRQQQAMLCALKDHIADILPLVDILIKHGLDIETANWSDQKDELNRLRASLCIARKRLRAMKGSIMG